MSAEVTYFDDEHELTEFQQNELKSTLNGILNKIVYANRKDALDEWIEDRTEMVIDESASSMFVVAALTIATLNTNTTIPRTDLKEVFLQLTRFLAEMDVELFLTHMTFKTQKPVVPCPFTVKPRR